MTLGENIKILELTMNMFGQKSTIYPVILQDQSGITLIDTGMPGQYENLKEAIFKAGANFEALNNIILTHQDIDHIGNLPQLARSRDNITVMAHEEEKPYIEGDKPLIKMNKDRMDQMLQALPEAMRQQVANLFANPPVYKVDRTLNEGDVLPIGGGIKVIHTPGHTPGHINLYLREEKLLIAGDELRVVDGVLLGPSEGATFDMKTALTSLQKLKSYPIEYVLCYHGGLYGPNASQRIEELCES